MTMYEHPDGHTALRLNVMQAIRRYMGDEWNQEEHGGYTLLKMILDKSTDDSLVNSFTSEDKAICEALIGPYGYSIFRMLCLKRNINYSLKPETTPQIFL